MQQTFQCELFAPTSQITASASDKRKYDMSRTFGYAPRYSEYKVSFDRYNGAFCDTLKSWVTGFNTHIFDSDRWNDMSYFSISVPQLLFAVLILSRIFSRFRLIIIPMTIIYTLVW